jgi:hypothetical protein
MRVMHFGPVCQANRRERVQRRRASWLACLAALSVALLGCVIPQAASAETFALSKVAEPSSECGVCMAIRVPTVPASSADATGPDLEGSGEKGGLDPKDLREASELPETGGSSQTVAVVDAYNDPYAESDLQEYRKKYKVYFKGTETECTEKNGCFKKIDQAGETEEEAKAHSKTFPGNSPGWSGEISLDVDMVSAACPECHILLVEASNEELASLSAANEEAVTKKATETSNSWGYVESSGGETSNDKYFDHPGIPTFAAAGDVKYDGCDHEYGAGICYPAASQYVISVGGVKLTKKGENWKAPAEEVWNEPSREAGTGSGCSKYEPKPPGQKELSAERSHCEHRLDNDVSADAAVESAVSVRDSYYTGGWEDFGGTSASSPFVAAVDAHATSATQLLGANAFYKKPSMLFDVTKGNNDTCTPAEDEYFCTAETGYDGPTGEGTPDNVFTSIAPAGATGFATKIETKGATLHGIVNPNGATTKYYFQYGTTESYGKTTAEESASSGTSDVEESKAITGLTGSTKYDFRIVTTNTNGTTYGLNQVFTTAAPVKPKVETKPASNVTETEATLNGTVNPEGVETKYYFEYGETTSYGSKTAEVSAGSGTSTLEESKAITGLTPDTPYHFRIVATNSEGVTAYGSDQVFTPGWSVQEPPSPTGAETLYVYGVSCTSSAACASVGDFHHSSSEIEQVPLAESWNGTAWSVQEPSLPTEATDSSLRGVSCTSSEACIAVGAFLRYDEWSPLAEKLEGTKWSIQEPPAPSTGSPFLMGVSCSSSTACMAVGDYGGKALAEKLEGTKWSLQEPPSPKEGTSTGLKSVSCTSSAACIAVGSSYIGSKGLIPIAERWNGTTWSVQELPYPAGEEIQTKLDGVSCWSSEECFAVGEETSFHLFIERLKGTTWSIQEAPLPTGLSHLLSVSCPSSTGCMAIGGVNKAGTDLPLAERWNGTAWSLQEPPSPKEGKEDWLDSISCTSITVCTGAGTFERESVKKPLVESYR